MMCALSMMGRTHLLWGKPCGGTQGFFISQIGSVHRFQFSQSYQLRVGHLLESMFAGSIAFFRWFTVSTLTHVHCDENAHVWSRLYIIKLNCKHCMRCQVPTTHHSMLHCVLADDCIGFRIKVQKHHIIVGHLHRIRFPNITWWIDMPKDFPIGEASNPGPE